MSGLPREPSVVVTAPGKIILFGEHSVVYGKKALAASIDQRMQVKLFDDRGRTDTLKLELCNFNYFPEWSIQELRAFLLTCKIQDFEKDEPRVDKDLVEALEGYLKLTPHKHSPEGNAALSFLYLLALIHHDSMPAMRVEVISELPYGAGLGSSAAYLVSLAAALLTNAKFVHPRKDSEKLSKDDLELVNAYAHAAEHIFHGRPSGVDNMVCVYGSALLFSKNDPPRIFETLPVMRIVIVDTNVTRSTKNLVEKVKLNFEKYAPATAGMFEAMNGIASCAEKVFNNLTRKSELDYNARTALCDLMHMNQMCLNALGVGHYTIDQVIDILSKFAIQGKLTGAGGGGSVVGFLPDELSERSQTKLVDVCQSRGFTCRLTTLGTRGVTVQLT